MPRYATQTEVGVERSRAEIEETLRRYGSTEFVSGYNATSGMIQFKIADLSIRIVLPLPNRSDKSVTHKKDRWGQLAKRTEAQIEREYDQQCRTRWRALLLVVKAKLEAKECGISTIEQEFMSWVVMPNNVTIGEWVLHQAMPAIKAGEMPRLMLAAPKDEDIDDADFTVAGKVG